MILWIAWNRNTIKLDEILISINEGIGGKSVEFTTETVYSAFHGKCFSIKINEVITKELVFVDIKLKSGHNLEK